MLHSPGRVELLEAAHHLAAAIGSAATISSAVEGVTRIVFALKAYARQSTQLEAVETDLAACLDTVLTLYQNQIRRGIELVKQIEPVPRIRAHPDELNQVWTNLVHNALQAMGGSGTLTVSLKSRDGFVVVAVGDTGRGIPAEIQSRIFDPFFTTKAMGEGSGLGLNTAKAIVEKHRGQIQFTSQPGRGTVFSVSLPLP
ncbi:sensor histidine kinase [Inhella gelatinilytica]|uniref:histidine kinase n=1 Tax=Inhella gelatinilytica TaxID=2795030 RepID=A0A931IYJ8_9BURK|nr:HAMP domain-containing sensor histidine kinase [Inhella gelatinilytica]MBH9553454.1 HAMP domain-containing histidine kinase [Inhella gelatinilytica]